MAGTHKDSKGNKAQPIFGVANFEKSYDLDAQIIEFSRNYTGNYQQGLTQFKSLSSRKPQPTNTMQKQGLHKDTRVRLRSSFVDVRKFLSHPHSLEISK
jgi:hypothetical protein